MNIDQVFSWILAHKQNYPGRHQESQPRTLQAFKPLEPKSQFHVIFKALSEYIKENLSSGKSVNIRGFGAFSFEVISDFVKPALFTTIDFRKTLTEQRNERKHVHKFRPCFVVDPQLKAMLSRYAGKEELSTTKSQNTVYQKGFGMIFCNPTPIAAACYLGKETVVSALAAFTTAVIDLTRLGYDLSLDFDFCKINIIDKNLKYSYRQDFNQQLNAPTFETKIKKSIVPTSSFWNTTYQEKWGASTLSGLYKVPDASKVQTLNDKTLALKFLSLDMNSTEKTFGVRGKSVNLPRLEGKKSAL